MDETQDPKPHITLQDARPQRGESLSIWFFCGILTLIYGVVLLAQAMLEHLRLFGQHPAGTVLANLHPTFWWGACLLVFGAFYTIRFRPGRS